MKDKKAFISVEQYFESIFRYAEKNPLEPSLGELSDLQGGRQIWSELKRIALKALPFDMGDSLERIAPHAVTNIARYSRGKRGMEPDR